MIQHISYPSVFSFPPSFFFRITFDYPVFCIIANLTVIVDSAYSSPKNICYAYTPHFLLFPSSPHMSLSLPAKNSLPAGLSITHLTIYSLNGLFSYICVVTCNSFYHHHHICRFLSHLEILCQLVFL